MKPVIVYIHGGGFASGSSNKYAPDFFIEEDVLLVTVNYRHAVNYVIQNALLIDKVILGWEFSGSLLLVTL